MLIKGFYSIFLLTLFISCAGNSIVIPEKDLQTLSAKKIFELGAERYMNYEYNEAIYYYSNIIVLYPDDTESRAWAKYEIGYVKYQQKNYQEALEYFNKVLSIKSPTAAPQILANQMKMKIEKLQTK